MKRVYVAGPYSADNVLDVLKNIGYGQKICGMLFLAGFYPFCPWHDKDYVIDYPEGSFTKEHFQEASMAWLEVSDCVLVIGDWEKSGGVKREIARAEEVGIPVYYHIDDLLERK